VTSLVRADDPWAVRAVEDRPEPIVSADGRGSEHFTRTGMVITSFRCPNCDFRCGAETREVPDSGLPPELRDAAAWRQEAEAKKAQERAAHLIASARHRFDAHVCGRKAT